MQITTAGFITVVGGVMLSFAVGLVAWALIAGLRGKYDLVFWRSVKLWATLIGFFGVVLLLLNFDKAVRDAIGGRSREYAFRELIELKLYTTRETGAACAKEHESNAGGNNCFDYRNIDNQIRLSALQDGQAIGP
jgi:hypothetical protein